jgi:hypothetical protein
MYMISKQSQMHTTDGNLGEIFFCKLVFFSIFALYSPAGICLYGNLDTYIWCLVPMIYYCYHVKLEFNLVLLCACVY